MMMDYWRQIMKLNGRFDTIIGSIYWEDGKLLSIHTNAMTQELEQKLSEYKHFGKTGK